MTRFYTADTRSYFREVLQLTRSLLIHMPAIAEKMNQELKLSGYTIEREPHNWRYYQHLAGQYHKADRVMTVNSFDTYQPITFNRENLSYHTRTYRYYATLGNYYHRLVDRYPDQELLIRGILSSIDPQAAYNSREGTILAYNDTYIEPQEYEFIERLEQWIIKFLDRWSNEAYTQTDELYTPARFGVLIAHIPNAILHIRHQLQGSAQAHSFYIRQRLASYGEIDKYIAGFSFEQIHFLYRNARYLLHHAGTKRTLDILIKNLAEPLHLPLAAHEIRQRISPITGIIKQNQDELPDIDAPIDPIPTNRSYILSTSSNDIYTGSELIDHFRPVASTRRQMLTQLTTGYQSSTEDLELARRLETDLAIANESTWDKEVDTITRSIRLHNRATAPSKLIDSIVEDRSNVQVYRYEQIVLSNWFDLAERGIYNRRTLMIDPISREEVLLTMRDLLLVFIYASNRQYGIELIDIPDLYALGVKRDDPPSRDQLSKLTNLRFIENHELIDREIRIYSQQFPSTPSNIISFDYFVEYNEQISRFRKLQYIHYTQGQDPFYQAQMEAIAYHYWYDHYLPLSRHGNFVDYFTSIGYRIDQVIDPLNLQLLAHQALEQATGLGINDRTEFERAQRSLMGLLRRLSSYSVQFARQLISKDMYLIDPRSIRHSLRSSSQAIERFALHPIDAISMNSRAYKRYQNELSLPSGDVNELRRIKSFQHNLGMNVSPYKERIKYTPIPNRPVVTHGIEKK